MKEEPCADWGEHARQKVEHVQRPCGQMAVLGTVIKGEHGEGSTIMQGLINHTFHSTELDFPPEVPWEAIDEAWAVGVAQMDLVFKIVIGG